MPHTGEKVVEEGAKDFKSAMKDATKAVSHISPSEISHTVLSIPGMIPIGASFGKIRYAG